jgi:hypothetical protein
VLVTLLQRDAHQAGAGGLRLLADDRHLLADQRIHQRGFASVGRAQHGNEAAGHRGRGGLVGHNKGFQA